MGILSLDIDTYITDEIQEIAVVGIDQGIARAELTGQEEKTPT